MVWDAVISAVTNAVKIGSSGFRSRLGHNVFLSVNHQPTQTPWSTGWGGRVIPGADSGKIRIPWYSTPAVNEIILPFSSHVRAVGESFINTKLFKSSYDYEWYHWLIFPAFAQLQKQTLACLFLSMRFFILKNETNLLSLLFSLFNLSFYFLSLQPLRLWCSMTAWTFFFLSRLFIFSVLQISLLCLFFKLGSSNMCSAELYAVFSKLQNETLAFDSLSIQGVRLHETQ